MKDLFDYYLVQIAMDLHVDMHQNPSTVFRPKNYTYYEKGIHSHVVTWGELKEESASQ